MDFDISVAKGNTHIIVNVNAPMTVELGRRCGAEATVLGKETGIDRYLFDLRGSPNVDGSTRNYEFATRNMAEFGWARKARSALLTDPGDQSHDFITRLMENAGYNVKMFDDEQAAIDWLLE